MRLSTTVSGFVAAIFIANGAAADGVRVHGRVNAALPATGPQRDEQSWGALTAAMLEVPIVRQVGVGVELGAVTLSDGSAPADATLADADGASGFSGALALHVRSPERSTSGRKWHSGLWGGSSFGVMRSDGLFRMMGEVNVGLDLPLGSGGIAAGPSVGLLHVFQPDGALRPEDANVMSFGLHGLFDSAAPAPAAPPAPAPRADRDGDGVFDDADTCPDAKEDADGHEDVDGCPDPDNDADGLADADDRCPLDPEDKDGVDDEDGCADKDDDKDGVLEPGDNCPLEPEDADGHVDTDGCPDPDNDHDGVLDARDSCPAEPETENGYADEDGCPDAQSVRVVGDKIVLDERIHFATNSAFIRSVSYPLLRRVGELLNDHPEYIHIEIQGHADARGDAGFNQRVSEARAQAVEDFLIDVCGVEASRLSHAGYGSSQPLVAADDPRSLYMNRRVEFDVTRGAPGQTVQPALGTPEESVPEQTIEADGASESAPEDNPEAEPDVIELGDEP
jgi:outer membrane protein OmpA-like peptidoglycan-associated protein